MNALKWITTEAKQLRRKYPRRFSHLANPWRDGYMAQASAAYARKHKGKSPKGKKKTKKKIGAVKYVEKKENKATKPKTVYKIVRNKKGQYKKIQSIGSIHKHVKIAREGLEKRLAAKMLDQYKAPTKTRRKKIGKEITRLKQQINRLK